MFTGHFTWFNRLVVVVAALSCWPLTVQAQITPFPRFPVVGGVSVDAQGVVRNATLAERAEVLDRLRKTAQSPTGKLVDSVSLRMVSLVKLQRLLAQAISEGSQLPDDVLYLAGLQRIEYVFVYPQATDGSADGDIVLAGPAETWTIRDDASVVGKQSGRPVLRLEDLLVALRSSSDTRDQVISVSIDPTPEGQMRLEKLLSRIGSGSGFSPSTAEPALREAFGPQRVTLTGLPQNSRMAQTLVAADFQMKRLAMNLTSSPIKNLPSYLEMIRNTGAQRGVQPRWWITCDYDSIAHSQDRLAWKISGRGIKTLTEDDSVDATGNRVGSGNVSKQAQRWADMFTEKFDELCALEPAFGDLRSIMDLNIVATIISSQQLQQLSGCDLSLLLGQSDQPLPTPEWQVPKWLEPQCSFIRGQAGWTISASGGVEINPWKIVSQLATQDESVKSIRLQSAASGQQWWWD
ncbi:MAG: DUF1598 domain-containing protein [Pirellulaceae bacterium]|nr:DUF1598 domain-containing protein [Pirellulaceae bacterium]